VGLRVSQIAEQVIGTGAAKVNDEEKLPPATDKQSGRLAFPGGSPSCLLIGVGTYQQRHGSRLTFVIGPTSSVLMGCHLACGASSFLRFRMALEVHKEQRA
jgi:hypothetical protein